MAAKRVTMTFDLNEPQQATFAKMLRAFMWCDSANIIVRRDGQDLRFEADWLYAADTKSDADDLTRVRPISEPSVHSPDAPWLKERGR